ASVETRGKRKVHRQGQGCLNGFLRLGRSRPAEKCSAEVGVMSNVLLADLRPAERLALAYAPARARTATLALMALDNRLGTIVRQMREPIAAQLRLAWWRDTLARPVPEWPQGEPVLAAL